MLKKIISVIFAVIIIASVMSVSSYAASGIDYAYDVKGGTVKNVDELIAAFTDDKGVAHAELLDDERYPNTVILRSSVKLKSMVAITKGSYTIIGGGCTVYRDFDGGAMFLVYGMADSVGLSLGNIVSNDSWQEENFQLTIDGNRENYPYAYQGLIAVIGKASLAVNSRVILKNSSSSDFGGAIYAEVGEMQGYDRTPLAPEVSIKNAIISDCDALLGGGAVALNGYLSGTNDGSVSIERTTIRRCYAKNEEKSGKGGALYSVGGTLNVKNLAMNGNSADLGGAVYTCSEGTFESVTLTENTSTVAGGAIFGATKEGVSCNLSYKGGSITSCKTDGDGGAITNEGKMSFENTVITENEALGDGGAILNSGVYEMKSGNVYDNVAGGIGGGICSVSPNSEVIINDGEINSNKANLCGGMYCEGKLKMTGGAIGNSEGDFPQIVVKGQVTLGGNAIVKEDTLALCAVTQNGKKVFPTIKLESALTSRTGVTVAFCEEKLDSDGTIKGFKNTTKNGMCVLIGEPEIIEKSTELVAVKSRGLLSYKINDNGECSVRFIFLPMWVWLIIIIAILGITGFIFRKQLLKLIFFIKGKFKKKKAPIVHHKRR